MKTFVLLLLLSNIAYFGWNQGWLRDVPIKKAAVATSSRPKPFEQAPATLKLLAELPAAERVEREPAALASEFVDESLQQLDQQLSQQPNDSTEAVPADIATVTADTINNGPEAASPIATVTAGTEVASSNSPAWCGKVGLFEQEAQASALLPELVALGLKAQLNSGAVPVSSTYWVYIPALPSEAEAFELLKELQDKGIDSYYMRSGDMAGGISLGVFSRRESAEVAQGALSKKGYQASIGQVFKQEPRWWLQLQASNSAFLESPDWQALKALHDGLPVLENVCEVVASPIQFP